MIITGLNELVARKLLSTPRRQSLRLNPLRAVTELTDLEPIKWCDNGFTLRENYSVDDELTASGKAYIQNASSWLPVLALDPMPHDTILDACASPGGKSSHIQAITNNQSSLVCNDNSRLRLMKLKANMDRLNARATYTLYDARSIARRMKLSSFDKILLDAPCSGEGLMTLDDLKLFDSWSIAHIRRLSSLQKKILNECWQLLKPGGVLVYSTCTMAPEENEAVVDYFLRRNPDASLAPLDFPLSNQIPALQSWNGKPFRNDLSNCLRLTPSRLTEAFFVAKLTKHLP